MAKLKLLKDSPTVHEYPSNARGDPHENQTKKNGDMTKIFQGGGFCLVPPSSSSIRSGACASSSGLELTLVCFKECTKRLGKRTNAIRNLDFDLINLEFYREKNDIAKQKKCLKIFRNHLGSYHSSSQSSQSSLMGKFCRLNKAQKQTWIDMVNDELKRLENLSRVRREPSISGSSVPGGKTAANPVLTVESSRQPSMFENLLRDFDNIEENGKSEEEILSRQLRGLYTLESYASSFTFGNVESDLSQVRERFQLWVHRYFTHFHEDEVLTPRELEDKVRFVFGVGRMDGIRLTESEILKILINSCYKFNDGWTDFSSFSKQSVSIVFAMVWLVRRLDSDGFFSGASKWRTLCFREERRNAVRKSLEDDLNENEEFRKMGIVLSSAIMTTALHIGEKSKKLAVTSSRIPSEEILKSAIELIETAHVFAELFREYLHFYKSDDNFLTLKNLCSGEIESLLRSCSLIIKSVSERLIQDFLKFNRELVGNFARELYYFVEEAEMLEWKDETTSSLKEGGLELNKYFDSKCAKTSEIIRNREESYKRLNLSPNANQDDIRRAFERCYREISHSSHFSSEDKMKMIVEIERARDNLIS